MFSVFCRLGLVNLPRCLASGVVSLDLKYEHSIFSANVNDDAAKGFLYFAAKIVSDFVPSPSSHPTSSSPKQHFSSVVCNRSWQCNRRSDIGLVMDPVLKYLRGRSTHSRKPVEPAVLHRHGGGDFFLCYTH